MQQEVKELFDEAILLEINVAQLYDMFRWDFPEDALFWAKLSLEERNHAALLEAGRDNFNPLNCFPHDLLAPSVSALVEVNEEIIGLIRKYNQEPPSREEAFNKALFLERSAGELHFQHFMMKEKGGPLDAVFQRLNMDDKDHAERIKSYMEEHNISIKQKLTCDNSL